METIKFELESIELLADRLEEYLLEITDNNQDNDSRIDNLQKELGNIQAAIFEARSITRVLIKEY